MSDLEKKAYRMLKEFLRGENKSIDKIKEAGMWAAGKADDVTWSVIWNAVKNEIADTRKDLTVGSKAYWEAVEDRFDHVIDETQVVDSVFHRSALMRNEDGLVRQIMSFMGEPTQSYNMIRRNAYDLYKKATPLYPRVFDNLGQLLYYVIHIWLSYQKIHHIH